MFGKGPGNIKKRYDERLLDAIDEVKKDWEHAKETQEAVYESNVNSELTSRTKLQEQKYLFLYREARRRKVHGRIQASVFDY